MPLEQLVRRSSQAILSSVTSHRIVVYGLLSTFAVLATIGNALKNHSNFYSVTIYLSKSSRSVLVLANFSFLLALIGGHIVQRIFFGSLRPNEVERLYERLWFFITESLLAFTIFRDEFDIPFALMFGFLLFVKSFHWLANDRVEWMDQRPYPGPPLLFHIRMSVLFTILWTTDLLMFLVAVENTLAYGVGGMVLFASEYGILMASVTNTISKYLLSAYDFRRAGRRGGETAPPWENKSMWIFYIELATDFLKLTTYLVFFTIIITFYGLPLNIVRDVYITARSFITRLRALHRYQTATRNMDQRYPNATEEEMSATSDRTCIICREEMSLQRPNGEAPATEGPNMTPKKLPCGHIFHFYCLRSWLERQQSCPTCRRTVLDNEPIQRPQGAARPNAAAPVPQPAAQGQPVDAPARVGAQNVNGPAGNNPFGLMGRFFGAQAADRPLGAAAQIPNLLNAAAQPGGVVIQYNIQYTMRPGAQAQREQAPTAPQLATPLRPAPRLDGFQGPGEAWHPWPQNSVPVPVVDNPGSQSSDPQSTGQHEAGEFNSAASAPVEPNLTPREAAARAAALRMNSSSGSSFPLKASDDTQRTEGKGSSSRIQPSSELPSSQRLDAPSLIPLFDFDSQNSGFASAAQSVSLGRPAQSSNSLAAPRAAADPQIAASQSESDRQSANATDNARVPISSPTLTDDQLAVMDKVTREAIDERLKVLEGVSTAVYRCIDDLMRMRSALPLGGSSGAAQESAQVDSTSGYDAEVPAASDEPVSTFSESTAE